MTNFHLRWVAYDLIQDLRRRRLEICVRRLSVLEARELGFFDVGDNGRGPVCIRVPVFNKMEHDAK
jgi:hypothetical protein